jgi:hypothetical protein
MRYIYSIKANAPATPATTNAAPEPNMLDELFTYPGVLPKFDESIPF